ncbi:hypothetical protein CSIM01_10477 [Colletotrichum simmondsii]|uniref:Uncharacterized protein n=1 Tax=Colletotrichum simmondsii TaxID=703756 RepID=A0A135SQJ4_9PEZI|nr:hypothetical protein CSIM01_10477 [Colletotrichum simmondsii]
MNTTNSDKRIHESMAQSQRQDLQKIASRFNPDEEVVVVTDKEIYVQMNNGEKALDELKKNWQAQGFGNSNKRFQITAVEEPDAEEVGISAPESTKKPGSIAKESVVSEKAGASIKREED